MSVTSGWLMAKFIFKMESILSVKEKLEEQAKAEYSIEIMKLRQEEEKLEELENRKNAYQTRLYEAVMDTLNISEIKILEDSVENIKYNIKKLVEDNHIDILCIQEHCEESHLDSITIQQKFGLPNRCVFFNRQTAWANFGISIYSHYPIIRYGKINFNSEKNNSMWADILVREDTIRVFNNHLQTTDVSINGKKYEEYRSVKDWKGQARTLVNIVEQLKDNFVIRANQAIQVRNIIDTTRYPVIVCGDFNDTPVSFAYNHIAGNNLTDGFRDRGKGYGHSFNGIKGLLRIDFISYDKSFTGLVYDSPRLPWSDHNPIIMKIKLKTTSR